MSVPLFLIGLFLTCFFLHGELYVRRPGTAGLTRFYLAAAAGSAAGTLLVGVIAPLVLRANYDLACTLVVVALIALAVTWHDGWGMRMIWTAGAAGAIVVLSAQVRQYDDDTVALMRNFYGTLRVKESHLPPQSDTDRQLLNGTIEHGAEWFAPQFRGQPLTYYASNSGLGIGHAAVLRGEPQTRGRDWAGNGDGRGLWQRRGRDPLLRDQSPGGTAGQALVHVPARQQRADRRGAGGRPRVPGHLRLRNISM